jgi:ligand-binding sensor domain-containing protein
MIVSRPLILACVFLLTVSTRPADALDPTRQISQYGHTAWRLRDGFLGATPNAIAQTADGYLWIGTDSGLLRFDGVRFVAWTPPGGKQLPSPTVRSLLAARDGSLWIGTEAGLSHWVNQDLTNYQTGRGLISSILEDHNGAVWITRTRPLDDAGCLCQVIGAGMRCYGKADGIPFSEGGALVEDALGNFWLGSSTGLVRWKPGSFDSYTPSAMQPLQGVAGGRAAQKVDQTPLGK